MKKVIDGVGDVGEGRGGGNGFGGDAVAALRQGGNERGVGGSDQCGVVSELRQLPGAHQNGSEFQNRKTLAGSGRNGGFHVEEHNLGSIFTERRTHFLEFKPRELPLRPTRIQKYKARFVA